MEKSSSSSSSSSTSTGRFSLFSPSPHRFAVGERGDRSLLRNMTQKMAVAFKLRSSSKGVDFSGGDLADDPGCGSRSGSGVEGTSSGGKSSGCSSNDVQFSFSLKDILKATNNFSKENMIGEGGFGNVYRGQLRDGSVVAVKRAHKNMSSKHATSQFKNEILAFSKIQHRSLVRLFGYVEEGDEKVIVVEYIGNGTLLEHLEGKRGGDLEIAQRLEVAIDVAHAIAYLHNYNDPPIIHRDIKTSNILLTEKLRAKVADFGLARLLPEDEYATHISTQVKGTAGYLDPEYLKTYQLTDKSDVFSFGVVLVELVTGRRPFEPKKHVKERTTAIWALQKLREGAPVLAMDPRLRRNPASVRTVGRMLKLGRRCLSPSRLSRPSMKECAEELWSIRNETRDQARLSLSATPTMSKEPWGSKQDDNIRFASA